MAAFALLKLGAAAPAALPWDPSLAEGLYTAGAWAALLLWGTGIWWGQHQALCARVRRRWRLAALAAQPGDSALLPTPSRLPCTL